MPLVTFALDRLGNTPNCCRASTLYLITIHEIRFATYLLSSLPNTNSNAIGLYNIEELISALFDITIMARIVIWKDSGWWPTSRYALKRLYTSSEICGQNMCNPKRFVTRWNYNIKCKEDPFCNHKALLVPHQLKLSYNHYLAFVSHLETILSVFNLPIYRGYRNLKSQIYLSLAPIGQQRSY